MTTVYHTLYSPRRPAGSTGSAFAVHFNPKGNMIDIVNHIHGGMGCSMPIKAARLYYKSLLKEGYVKE